MSDFRDKIIGILTKSEQPLSLYDIYNEINSNADLENLELQELKIIIRSNQDRFQQINKFVFLTSDNNWKSIITSYLYIKDSLRGILPTFEIQLLVCSLFYFKRIEDLKDKTQEYSKRHNIILKRKISGALNATDASKISYHDIILEFVRIASKLSSSQIDEFYKILDKTTTIKYNDYVFGDIFEYLIHTSISDNSEASYSYTPSSLRQLMVELLAATGDCTICDPVSGTGGLLVEASLHASKLPKLIGYEVNRTVALLNLMNLEMHNVFNNEIIAENCFKDLDRDKRFDFIIGDLPIEGVGSYKDFFFLFTKAGIQPPSTGKGFSAILLYTLSKLKKTGRAVLTVSEGFLNRRGREADVRNLLINEDIIESVIGLPSGALRPHTEANAAILVLNRNKILKNKIKFITARTTYSDRLGIDLNIKEVIEAHESSSLNSENYQVIDSEHLKSKNNLSTKAYDSAFFLTRRMLEEGSGRKLGDVVEIKSGVSIEKKDLIFDGTIPYIKIENLSSEILNIYLTLDQVKTKVYEDPSLTRSLISNECILIARIGETLKPTYFKPSDRIQKIITHNSVYSIYSKGNLINLEYLYYQLHSSFIKEQLSLIKHGSIMPFINISGLKEIVIPYIDLKAQLEFIRSQKANIIATERAKIEEKIKLLGIKEERVQVETDIVRTLVHQLRPTLLNIDLEVKKIKSIVRDNNLDNATTNIDNNVPDEEIEHLISMPMNYSLIDIINKLQHDTLQLNDILSTVNKVMSFKITIEDMEEVDLLSFFKKYLEIKKLEFNSIAQLNVIGEHFKAIINKSSFKELIDQLILNASKHAFTKSSRGNAILFIIKQHKTRGVAIIDYQNNGKPYKLTLKDFISPFIKSQNSKGSGIGGNYIYRIVEAHKGQLHIREDLKLGFALSIEIPLKPKHNGE